MNRNAVISNGSKLKTMTKCLISMWLLPVLGVSGQSGAEPSRINVEDNTKQDEPSSDTGAEIPKFHVRETQAETAVITEYSGPYWGIGPVLRRVRAHMMESNLKGATFVQYPQDPRSGTQALDATLVGYFAAPGFRPPPPYVVEHWRPHLVATVTVLGPLTETTALYSPMREWAVQQGFDVLGPIVEIYYPMEPNAPIEDQQTEIRMPIIRRADQIPLHAQDRRITASDGSPPIVANHPGVDEPAPRTIVDRDPAESNSQDVTKQSRLPGYDPVVSTPPDGGPPSADPLPVPVHVELQDLIDQEKFDELAARLIPENQSLDQRTRDWMEQLVSRIIAIDKGLDRRPDAHPQPLGKIADALRQRLREQSDASPFQATKASPLLSKNKSTLGQEQSAVLQELDRVMSRMALGTITASECMVCVIESLKRVERAVESTQEQAKIKSE